MEKLSREEEEYFVSLDKVHQICSMLSEGINSKEIVAQINTTYDLVHNIHNNASWMTISEKYGINTKVVGLLQRPRFTREEVIQVKKLLRMGYSAKQVSDKLELSFSVVYNLRKFWRLEIKNSKEKRNVIVVNEEEH